MFLNNGYKFPGKRADDLFTRSNSDGDTTISAEEFVSIYTRELEDAAEKRKKLAENMVRLRNRNQGYCHRVTRLFAKSDVKTIVNGKKLDKFNQEKLNNEMIELEEFAEKLEKKNAGGKNKRPGALVLGNANTKLVLEDAEELEQITNFFGVYGKDNRESDNTEENGVLSDEKFDVVRQKSDSDKDKAVVSEVSEIVSKKSIAGSMI